MTNPRRVFVPLGARSYEILIGPGLLGHAGRWIAPILNESKAIIVTESRVGPLYAGKLEASLDAAGVKRGATVTLPAGEGTKDFAHFAQLCEAVLAQGIDRGTQLIALGGGVIGDLVGFAAASLLRGIDFIQIPTTLLAQVDSSVGGKTGINSAHGKNLIGAFHQPRLVLADTDVLTSLPAREVKAGYAEVLKYGLIRDRAFFDWLEENGAAVLALQPDAVAQAVSVSCAAKAAIVAADERESGERALLNFGHTFGHALEAAYGFSNRLLHGEAVAIGMSIAFELSAELGFCSRRDEYLVNEHIRRGQLIPSLDGLLPFPSIDDLMSAMTKDKKVSDGRLVFILAHRIGDAFVAKELEVEKLREFLSNILNFRKAPRLILIASHSDAQENDLENRLWAGPPPEDFLDASLDPHFGRYHAQRLGSFNLSFADVYPRHRPEKRIAFALRVPALAIIDYQVTDDHADAVSWLNPMANPMFDDVIRVFHRENTLTISREQTHLQIKIDDAQEVFNEVLNDFDVIVTLYFAIDQNMFKYFNLTERIFRDLYIDFIRDYKAYIERSEKDTIDYLLGKINIGVLLEKLSDKN